MIVYAKDARRDSASGARALCFHRMVRAVTLVWMLLLISSRGIAGGLLVTWDPNSESDLAGYRIYYGTAPSIYTVTVDVGNTTSHVIENLSEGETYYVVVTAYDQSSNESLPSTEVSATVTAAEIYIVLQDDGIQIRWSALAGADLYRIYASDDPYFIPTTPVSELSATSYTDRVQYKSTPFSRYYVVEAIGGGTAFYTFDQIGAFSKTLTRGQNLISTPLVPQDNSVSSVIGAQLNGAGNAGQSDKILYWNGKDYEIAWLVEGTNTPYDGKWMTQAGDQESSLKIDPDHSFWVLLRSTASDSVLTFTGKVSKGANRAITLVQGLNFIGTCYPVSISLPNSELASDGVVAGGSSSGKADKIMRWLGDRYEVAWLVGGTGSAWDGSWLNESGSAATAIQFNPGVGYILWIKGNNASTLWTYPNPQLSL